MGDARSKQFGQSVFNKNNNKHIHNKKSNLNKSAILLKKPSSHNNSVLHTCPHCWLVSIMMQLEAVTVTSNFDFVILQTQHSPAKRTTIVKYGQCEFSSVSSFVCFRFFALLCDF
eukprot:c13150_g1_i1.p1 GENE.c13150_g1_i1~~c13150_g1_i1.p1  ORF type:complete len:115 (+),score=15.69 c13150_g1_i1:2-346(+)